MRLRNIPEAKEIVAQSPYVIKNPAERKTLELLKVYGVVVMETRDGDITVTSDGTAIQIKQ